MYGDQQQGNPEYGPPREPAYYDQTGSNSWGPMPPAYFQPSPSHTTIHVNPPRPFNHGPHLIGDLFTCGLWLPFHILLWVLHRG